MRNTSTKSLCSAGGAVSASKGVLNLRASCDCQSIFLRNTSFVACSTEKQRVKAQASTVPLKQGLTTRVRMVVTLNVRQWFNTLALRAASTARLKAPV